jgi:hypothetical protein
VCIRLEVHGNKNKQAHTVLYETLNMLVTANYFGQTESEFLNSSPEINFLCVRTGRRCEGGFFKERPILLPSL